MGGLLAAGQPDYAVGCAWNFGWAGWAVRLGSKLLAGLGLRPVADVRHASIL